MPQNMAALESLIGGLLPFATTNQCGFPTCIGNDLGVLSQK